MPSEKSPYFIHDEKEGNLNFLYFQFNFHEKTNIKQEIKTPGLKFKFQLSINC